MDTVHEENSGCIQEEDEDSSTDDDIRLPLNNPGSREKSRENSVHFFGGQIPHINVINENNALVLPRSSHNHDSDSPSAPSSRRPSAIIAALRRPSQAIALSAAHAVMNQRRYFLGLMHGHSDDRDLGEKPDPKEESLRKHNRALGDDALTTILSALYAKLLIVLGMAFPITEIISNEVRPFFYQGFYLYLYLVSIAFVAYMYGTYLREKQVNSIIDQYKKAGNASFGRPPKHPVRYGSFYLRLGAIAFGIGSMVYSGLEFGRYFELRNNLKCYSNVLQAITPATRMVLTLVQVQFIFLNTKNVDMNRHRIPARFGLMHMIATNVCEWLYVLVEETKHEIIHLGEHTHNNATAATNGSSLNAKYCQEGQVMGSLVTNASPFLFPCTIEYSLICAVILFEMWKKVKGIEAPPAEEGTRKKNNHAKHKHEERVSAQYNFNPFTKNPLGSQHHFSVDCSNAHRGLFAGIMVIVLVIISLIMFFVLADQQGEEKNNLINVAEIEVTIVELILYIITTIAVIVAMWQMRSLKYDRKAGHQGLGLDNTLLVMAQTGMFIYCMFSIIGCYFTMGSSPTAILAEIFSFIQTCLQTMFILDGWWRRYRNLDQLKKKPGRELITFLIVSNMAMWTINTLEKNRAEFRPTHLKFFGDWAWTVITHISMPLAIFYRLHSTICLFEIWKTAYKMKPLKGPVLPYM